MIHSRMGNILSQDTLQFKVIESKQNATNLLQNAENIDMYLEECYDDDSNSIARRTCTYSPNHVSLNEYKNAIAYLELSKSKIPQRLLMELEEIYIIQLMPSAEGGMPHTRPGDIICYPDISRLYSESTLIHELWHIHQRKYKDIWLKVFDRIGWKLWDGELPGDLEKYRRFNPDTIDCPFFIFQEKWVPIPIFRNITQPNIGEVDIWFYNVQKNVYVKKIPDEFSYFGNIPIVAFEHPREITAYILSEHEKYGSSDAFRHLIEAIGYTSIS
jgi:hypothetical protein